MSGGRTADGVSSAVGLLSAEWLCDKRGEGGLKEAKSYGSLGYSLKT